MRTVTTKDLITAIACETSGANHEDFSSIETDSRKINQKGLFIALKGDQFDAHDFIAQAFQNGCRGFVVSQFKNEWREMLPQASFFKVKDTLKALQDLACYYRKKSSAMVVGITGSNGKTTSKEFTAAVLSTQFRVHFSKGSFNNHWGVPLSLLSEPAHTQVSVIEMGMNHAGEITQLCQIALPDVVVCSMVGTAHIEFFGTVEKIAQAKEEIYAASPMNSDRIFNLDNPHTQRMHQKSLQQRLNKAPITFSEKISSADIFMQVVQISAEGMLLRGSIARTKGEVHVPVFGRQNVTNLMVAASVACALGMAPEKIWSSLQNCKSTWGRNQILKTTRGSVILFDGYNANPDSMRALLDNVPLMKNVNCKWACFAEMLELGDQSANLHEELGYQAGLADFDGIWFYGPHFENFKAGVLRSKYQKKLVVSNSYEDSLANEVASMLSPKDVLFVKGSRGMKVERIVQQCDPIGFSSKKE